ncbi:hypothetical protein E2562_021449 [Oryza meyeriana var. granulata]|uniref:Uncharacterized protein n=1 Tax=Oryza meyeriana var. granulata TaxID=110450 RepID=A0A6G1C926_9ORYZ|nr:hypothetical protein E2562_021449 [Oryza meyeriana var. granulata]
MRIKGEKVPVEIDDSNHVTFHCAICMEYKPMHSRFHCEAQDVGLVMRSVEAEGALWSAAGAKEL